MPHDLSYSHKRSAERPARGTRRSRNPLRKAAALVDGLSSRDDVFVFALGKTGIRFEFSSLHGFASLHLSERWSQEGQHHKHYREAQELHAILFHVSMARK